MLWTVAQTADFLHVSVSWVRRHLVELPIAAMPGRLIRVDSERLQSTMADGKSLKSERVNMTPRRYQRGSIVWRTTKRGKVCYGIYRVDVQTSIGFKREQKKVRLGTRKEVPTDSQARKKLNDIISHSESGPPVPQPEPYSTLVHLVTRIPLRIEEAIGVKWTDLDGHVLTLNRVVYEGKAYELQPSEKRKIPIMDIELLARMRKLGTGRVWVFQSRNGTPINPCNARRRFLKPAAKELEINLCGWHDFRHSLTTELRRNGTHPKVISDLLGHKKVNLAMDVYDRSNLQDFEQALRSTAEGCQLLPSCDQKVNVQ
jgi:integrase